MTNTMIAKKVAKMTFRKFLIGLLTSLAACTVQAGPPQPLGKYSIKYGQAYIYHNGKSVDRATLNRLGGYNYQTSRGFARGRQNGFGGESLLVPHSGNKYVRPLRIR